jgi:ABC-type amino acid transport substrate-binding protein
MAGMDITPEREKQVLFSTPYYDIDLFTQRVSQIHIETDDLVVGVHQLKRRVGGLGDATCTFTNQAFDSLIPGLKFRRFDAVMAGMDITPERYRSVRPLFCPSADQCW